MIGRPRSRAWSASRTTEATFGKQVACSSRFESIVWPSCSRARPRLPGRRSPRSRPSDGNRRPHACRPGTLRHGSRGNPSTACPWCTAPAVVPVALWARLAATGVEDRRFRVKRERHVLDAGLQHGLRVGCERADRRPTVLGSTSNTSPWPSLAMWESVRLRTSTGTSWCPMRLRAPPADLEAHGTGAGDQPGA
jgi:hypothetical protein